MFNPKSILLVTGLMLFCLTHSQAQWTKISSSQKLTNIGKAEANISEAATFKLNQKFIADISSLELPEPNKQEIETKEILLPLPDGKLYKVRLHQTALFHPDLLKKYPGILSFTGYGVEDPSSLVKCSIGENGFHAMIISSKLGNIFIDPLHDGNSSEYVCYNKKDYSSDSKKVFECGVEGVSANSDVNRGVSSQVNAPDCIIRKYRLALACTGEYASFHGGTVTKVLSAMNTTMTRVSGVYERDLSVTFQIIADNDKLIFLDAQSDPYTNNNGGSMLGQNQQTVDNLIGNANYDIGHVFSTGGGGIANLFAVCNQNSKARGVTGSSKPIGDPYDIDYVCHEMGHQFNANHSFNNTCGGNINDFTAFEPGSGTTIMGYAGVCDPNVQLNSDAYFHNVSLNEISTYVTQLAGNTCPEKINNNNIAPTVDAGPDRIIPKSTPFELTATGQDADGDTLSYCWEQMNKELVTHPPVNTYTGGPSFRSFYPVANPTRVFPQISTIVNNSTSLWEVLPAVARNLKFAVTARDNHNSGGCFHIDEMSITVDGASGPFLVTNPNTILTWTIGTIETVTWDVSKTDQVPVNCFYVDIYLSTDGGYTYPHLLAESVPNTGSYLLQVPNIPGTKNRIKVKAHGNVFFDISNKDFTIKEPTSPSIYLSLNKNNTVICADKENEVSTILKLEPLAGFNEEVNVSVTGLPTGVIAEIQPQITNLPADVTITLKALDQLAQGTYTTNINVASATVNKTTEFVFSISTGTPAKVVLLSVPANSKNTDINTQLSWDSVPGTKTYHVTVAKDINFTNKILDVETISTNISIPGLDYYTVYFWKVSASNDCGSGPDSDIRVFQTINKVCKEFIQNTPVTIPNNKVFNGTSTLDITENFIFSEMTVKVKALHSYLVDLTLEIQDANNNSVVLLANNCGGLQDVDAVFSDQGQILNCNTTSPAVSGIVKPATGELNKYSGNDVFGTWKLKIDDNYPQDGGQLQSWSINVCAVDSTTKTPLISRNNILYIAENQTEKLDSNYLLSTIENTSPANIRYFIMSPTQNGQLRKGLNVLKPGDWFTQADITNKLISYKNNSFGTGKDSFNFYILDASGNWTPEQQFNIVIYKPLQANTDTKHVQCYGDNDGQVSILAEFGVEPYQYSLNGASFADSSVFTSLTAGNYNYQVKDAIGQLFTGNFSIQQPDSLIVTIIKQGYNIVLNVTGGVPPYQAGTDGVNFGEELFFNNLPVGTQIFYVKDNNNCIAIDSVNIVTAVNEQNQIAFSVYPVPADGTINIKLSNAMPVSVKITDCMGRMILGSQSDLKSGEIIQLDTRHLPSGMYVLRVENEKISASEKLIIQH